MPKDGVSKETGESPPPTLVSPGLARGAGLPLNVEFRGWISPQPQNKILSTEFQVSNFWAWAEA